MKTPNILIVDDESESRDTIKKFIIERIQCNIYEAADGEKALECLNKNACDIMVLDIRMPKKSGMDVLDEAQKITKNIDIIVATAWDSELVAEECAKRNVECLPKPLILTELYGKMVKLLKKRGQLALKSA